MGCVTRLLGYSGWGKIADLQASSIHVAWPPCACVYFQLITICSLSVRAKLYQNNSHFLNCKLSILHNGAMLNCFTLVYAVLGGSLFMLLYNLCSNILIFLIISFIIENKGPALNSTSGNITFAFYQLLVPFILLSGL